MSSDQIIGLYERHARAWISDRSRQTKFIEKLWLDRFAALARPRGAILDIGCGSGKPIAAYLLARGFDVLGIDSSPTMISLARTNFPDREWIVADMREPALERRFAGLLAWDSFFHLSHHDQQRMFPIFRDHAAPGAPLLFTSGPCHGEAIGSLYGEPLYHTSLAPDEYRSLLAANDFSLVAEQMEDTECGGHSVWLARRQMSRSDARDQIESAA